MNIKQALAALDITNDDHWTADGLPRVEAVVTLVGSEVTRRQITDADPSFVRPQASGTEFDPVGTPPTAEPDPKPAEKPAEETPAEEPTEAPPKETPAPEPNAPGAPPPEEAPPEPDVPADAAKVAVLDDVVTMNVPRVFSDIDLIERAITEFSRQAQILMARGDAIEKKLIDIGRRSASLQNAYQKLGKSTASQQRETIQRYLETQRAARAVRAERAQRFIEAGTTAHDVKAQLEGPSKIDAAMKSRKPGRGTARPAYPVAAP